MRMAALRTAAGLLAAFGLVAPSSAQLSYPNRQIEIVVPFTAAARSTSPCGSLAWRCRNGSDSPSSS